MYIKERKGGLKKLSRWWLLEEESLLFFGGWCRRRGEGNRRGPANSRAAGNFQFSKGYTDRVFYKKFLRGARTPTWNQIEGKKSGGG